MARGPVPVQMWQQASPAQSRCRRGYPTPLIVQIYVAEYTDTMPFYNKSTSLKGGLRSNTRLK
jgi:hypothetical protein